METILLVGKILLDKNSQKIGSIITCVKALKSDNNEKTEDDRIIARVECALRKKILVGIESTKVNRIQGHYAWLEMTLKEFDLYIKNAPKINGEEVIYKNRNLYQLKRYIPPPLHLLK